MSKAATEVSNQEWDALWSELPVSRLVEDGNLHLEAIEWDRGSARSLGRDPALKPSQPFI
jgi:hypothetical protein